jgi:hypothetical protein
MADPVSATLAGIGLASSAAGGIMGAFGSEYSGQANKTMYGYQSGIAAINSQLAKSDAEYARVAGEREAEIAGLKGREIVGATKAGYAAGNIDPTTGSAKGVLTSEAFVNAANQNTIRANAAKRAYGFEVTAAEDTAQSQLYTMAGNTSATAGNIGAVSSLLGGVGSVSSKWLAGQQAGIFGGSSGSGVNPDSAYGRDVYASSIYGT